MYSCLTHQEGLHYVLTKNAFLQAPPATLEDCYAVETNWTIEGSTNEYVQSFLHLSLSLPNAKYPVSLAKVRAVTSQRAEDLDIALFPEQADRHSLTDGILDRYPIEWLELLFPNISDKLPRGVRERINGMLRCSTSSSSIVAYLLGLCILYDNADDVIQALHQ
ncbi:hypothetical protein GM676_31300 [Duganella radicis]|uniref:Uncharacterized protein n=2 Tax=Duganella radicis TaxID=551988 RepID=A0A6L6PT38_9BURK|nr:hypothetical protein [Duganella radicis]MTV42032.1 hypothetical protein [Duganella radicis]